MDTRNESRSNSQNAVQSSDEKQFIFDWVAGLAFKAEAWYLSQQNPQEFSLCLFKLTSQNHQPSPTQWENAKKLYQGALELCADILQNAELKNAICQGFAPLFYENLFKSFLAPVDSRYQKNLDLTSIQDEVRKITQFQEIDSIMIACLEKGYGQAIIQFAISKGCKLSAENDFEFPIFDPSHEPGNDELYQKLITSRVFQDPVYLERYIQVFIFLYKENYLMPSDQLSQFNTTENRALQNALNEYQQARIAFINYSLNGGGLSEANVSPFYSRLLRTYSELNLLIAESLENKDSKYAIYHQPNPVSDLFFDRVLKDYLSAFSPLQTRREVEGLYENKNTYGVSCLSLPGEAEVGEQYLLDRNRRCISYADKENNPIFEINQFDNKKIIHCLSLLLNQNLLGKLSLGMGNNVVVNGLPHFLIKKGSVFETSGVDLSLSSFKDAYVKGTQTSQGVRVSLYALSCLSGLAVGWKNKADYYVPCPPHVILKMHFEIKESFPGVFEFENYECTWMIKKPHADLNITMVPNKLDAEFSGCYNFILKYKQEIYKINLLLFPEVDSFKKIHPLENFSLPALISESFSDPSSHAKRGKKMLADCIGDHLIKKPLPDYESFITASIAVLGEELKSAKKDLFACLQLFHFNTIVMGVLSDSSEYKKIAENVYEKSLKQCEMFDRKIKKQLQKYWLQLQEVKARLSTSGDFKDDVLEFLIKISYFRKYVQRDDFVVSDIDYLQLVQRFFSLTPILEYQLIAEQLKISIVSLLDKKSRLNISGLIRQLSQYVYRQMDLHKNQRLQFQYISSTLEYCIEYLLGKLKTDTEEIMNQLDRGIVDLFYDVLMSLQTLYSLKRKFFVNKFLDVFAIWKKRLLSYASVQKQKLDAIEKITYFLAQSYGFPNPSSLSAESPLELLGWVNAHDEDQEAHVCAQIAAMEDFTKLSNFYDKKSKFEKLNLKIVVATSVDQSQIKELALYYKIYFNYLETNSLKLDLLQLNQSLAMIVRFIKMLTLLETAFQSFDNVLNALGQLFLNSQISQCDFSSLSFSLPSLMKFGVTAEQLLKLCKSPSLNAEKVNVLTFRILSRLPPRQGGYIAEKLNAAYADENSTKIMALSAQPVGGGVSHNIKTALSLHSSQSGQALALQANLQPGTKLTQKLLQVPTIKDNLLPATVVKMLQHHPVLAEDFASQVQTELTKNYSNKAIKHAAGFFKKISLWWSSLFKLPWFHKVPKELKKHEKVTLEQLKLFLIKNPMQACPVLFFDEFTWNCLKTFVHESDQNNDGRSIDLSAALFLKEIIVNARKENGFCYQALLGQIRYNHHVRELLIHLEGQDLIEFLGEDINLALSMFRVLPKLVDKMPAGNEFKNTYRLLKGETLEDITPLLARYVLTALISPRHNIFYEHSASAKALQLILAEGGKNSRVEEVMQEFLGLQKDGELNYSAWELLAKHPGVSQELLLKPSWLCQQCKNFVQDQTKVFSMLLMELQQKGFKTFSQSLQKEYIKVVDADNAGKQSADTQEEAFLGIYFSKI